MRRLVGARVVARVREMVGHGARRAARRQPARRAQGRRPRLSTLWSPRDDARGVPRVPARARRRRGAARASHRLGLRLGDRLVARRRDARRSAAWSMPSRTARRAWSRWGRACFSRRTALARSGLVAFGSRVRYRVLVRLAPGIGADAARASLARAVTTRRPDRRLRRGPARAAGGSSRSSGSISASSAWSACSWAASASPPRCRAFVAGARFRRSRCSRRSGRPHALLVAAYMLQTQAVGTRRRPASGRRLGRGHPARAAAAVAGLVPFALEPQVSSVGAGARDRHGARGDAAVHV